MEARPRAGLIGKGAWAALAIALLAAGLFASLPAIRSEALGVYWPYAVRLAASALLVFLGLVASRRAGRLQYAVFAAAGLGVLIFIHATGTILDASGVQGVARR